MEYISATVLQDENADIAWARPYGESDCQGISRGAVEAELNADNLLTRWQDWVGSGSASCSGRQKSARMAETATLKKTSN